MNMSTNKKFAILEVTGGIDIGCYDSIDEVAYAAMYKTWALSGFRDETLNLLQSKINEMREEVEEMLAVNLSPKPEENYDNRAE